jgi:hypothetical protein
MDRRVLLNKYLFSPTKTNSTADGDVGCTSYLSFRCPHQLLGVPLAVEIFIRIQVPSQSAPWFTDILWKLFKQKAPSTKQLVHVVQVRHSRRYR